MANRIKTVSQYDGTNWGTEMPIGADASNVDVNVAGNTTRNLQDVLGTPPATGNITTNINNKVNISGGDVANTIVGSNITNYDSSTDAGSDILTDTAATVNTNTSSLWSRFNLFRKKVSNNFNNYFATTNLRTEVGSAAGDNTNVYTVGAINTYLSNVIGYTSAGTPDAGKVSSQLSTLKTTTTNHTSSISTLNTKVNDISDYVVERTTSNNWRCIKYHSGILIAERWWDLGQVTLGTQVSNGIIGSTSIDIPARPPIATAGSVVMTYCGNSSNSDAFLIRNSGHFKIAKAANATGIALKGNIIYLQLAFGSWG